MGEDPSRPPLSPPRVIDWLYHDTNPVGALPVHTPRVSPPALQTSAHATLHASPLSRPRAPVLESTVHGSRLRPHPCLRLRVHVPRARTRLPVRTDLQGRTPASSRLAFTYEHAPGTSTRRGALRPHPPRAAASRAPQHRRTLRSRHAAHDPLTPRPHYQVRAPPPLRLRLRLPVIGHKSPVPPARFPLRLHVHAPYPAHIPPRPS
ncbi:hypothetical protein B0H14DRAFT_3465071 [Mycena olivaceomarginata]|nr:hypothetical protein B0H14DRAFT_3465071 [Mycena olivaceomarginata]